MSRASQIRRAKRRASATYSSAPFDAWERREIPRGAYAAFFGDNVSPEVQAITHAFVNSRYAVQVSPVQTEWGPVEHLWVRRHDGAPVRSWLDLQRIKDELAGEARTAVEVFPPRGELMDAANIYHLWVLPGGFQLPFSLVRGGSR